MHRLLFKNIVNSVTLKSLAKTVREAVDHLGIGVGTRLLIDKRTVPVKPISKDEPVLRIIDFPEPIHFPPPIYPERPDEPLAIRKQRLVYQSRKRGMLENDLILSTFAAKYLKDMDEKLTAQYDHLINGVSNDWDIYYWATNAKPTPTEYDNEIMKMLKEHVANPAREQRLRQPDLY